MTVHSEHRVYIGMFKLFFMHVWVCVYVIPGVDMSQHARNLQPLKLTVCTASVSV